MTWTYWGTRTIIHIVLTVICWGWPQCACDMGEKNLFTETTVTIYVTKGEYRVPLVPLLCGSTSIKMRSETTLQPTAEIYRRNRCVRCLVCCNLRGSFLHFAIGGCVDCPFPNCTRLRNLPPWRGREGRDEMKFTRHMELS